MNGGLSPCRAANRAANRAAAPARPDPTVIAALEAGIRKLGGGVAAALGDDVEALSLGAALIDAALPWRGLPHAALHEIIAVDGGAPAIGFAAVLAGRFAGHGGTVVWCRTATGLYGPGLAAFGLDPARLVVVLVRRGRDVLWALEEALCSGAPAAVVGEVEAARPTALRRLQLAAEMHRLPAILVRSATAANGATPAVTRWRVCAVRSDGDGRPRPVWRLDLDRCRGRLAAAGPKNWIVEWHDATGDLTVVADVRHRPVGPGANGDPAC